MKRCRRDDYLSLVPPPPPYELRSRGNDDNCTSVYNTEGLEGDNVLILLWFSL